MTDNSDSESFEHSMRCPGNCICWGPEIDDIGNVIPDEHDWEDPIWEQNARNYWAGQNAEETTMWPLNDPGTYVLSAGAFVDDSPTDIEAIVTTDGRLLVRLWGEGDGFPTFGDRTYLYLDGDTSWRFRKTSPDAEKTHEPAAVDDEQMSVSSTGGVKAVKKARFDLLSSNALWEIAEHYGAGSAKYEDHNWRRGYEWSKAFASMMRHAWLFWGGEDIDPGTGTKHMAAVAFHAMSILEWHDTHPEFDDRWKGQG